MVSHLHVRSLIIPVGIEVVKTAHLELLFRGGKKIFCGVYIIGLILAPGHRTFISNLF
jgi:hypothetical protein